MSPISDPRFSETVRASSIDRQREFAEREARMEYVKSLIMLIIGAAGVMILSFFYGGTDAVAGATIAMLYPVGLTIELAVGVLGLWLAVALWLGDVGPFFLAVVRLAGIYAVTDLASALLGFFPVPIVGWILVAGIYIGLLVSMFELDTADAIGLAVLTFLLKIVSGLLLVGMLT